MIEARDVDVRRGRRVVRVPDWEVAAGARVAVVGPSGAGKSTWLDALAGLVPVRGELRVDGASPWRRGEGAGWLAAGGRWLGARVGRVLGEDPLLDDLDAVANTRLGARLGPGAALSRDAAVALLDALGLQSVIGRPVATLSSGERRRVAVARALAVPRALLLLDEPTRGLDPAATARVLDLLATRTAGATVVVATHDPSVAAWAGAGLALEGDGDVVTGRAWEGA